MSLRRNTYPLILGTFISISGLIAQPVIAGHQCTVLEQIPTQWIDLVKADYRLWYGHTSHGSQITSGMGTIYNLYGDQYGYNSSGANGLLSYQETGGDLGHNGSLAWEVATRAQLENPNNDRNVVMWSWCGGCSDNSEAGIDIYLNALNQLELDYPDMRFIYMTGHLDGGGEEGNLHIRNQQIREYCLANDKILFDFADIESYNPEGDYFLDLYANDNCDYQGGNWAQDWCAANPDADLCAPCGCAHSQALNCNLKGRAFWWMLAEMFGREHAPELATGDTNFDDNLDVLDIVVIVSYILGETEYTIFEFLTADVNGDQNIDVIDIVTVVAEIIGASN